MRIWLIGADQAGSNALRQLRKSPSVEIYVTDSSDRPRAVADGLLPGVDARDNVTPMNINTLARRIRPDLILVDRGAIQRSVGKVAGPAFTESLAMEMGAASEFPLLVL